MTARQYARMALAVALCVTGASAFAQTYRCVQGGSVVYQSTPCSDGGKLGMYGPAPGANSGAQSRGTTYVPPPPPSEHAAYMSPRCNQIREALTSAQRTTNPEVQRGLLIEWRNAGCIEDAQEAISAVNQKRQQAREEKRQQMVADQTSQRLNAQQSDQCAEMLRILAAKRKRTDMNDGERADLQRFEGVYTERCGAR